MSLNLWAHVAKTHVVLSNLRNGHVTLSFLGVEGHIISKQLGNMFVSKIQPNLPRCGLFIHGVGYPRLLKQVGLLRLSWDRFRLTAHVLMCGLKQCGIWWCVGPALGVGIYKAAWWYTRRHQLSLFSRPICSHVTVHSPFLYQWQLFVICPLRSKYAVCIHCV